MNFKRFLALIAVFLLVAMYVTTFILAFCTFPGADRILGGFVLLDIALPIILWLLIYTYKHFSSK